MIKWKYIGVAVGAAAIAAVAATQLCFSGGPYSGHVIGVIGAEKTYSGIYLLLEGRGSPIYIARPEPCDNEFADLQRAIMNSLPVSFRGKETSSGAAVNGCIKLEDAVDR